MKMQEAQRKADALEPLVAAAPQGEEAAAGRRVASTVDTAERVAKMKAARQGLQEEMRRLDVRVGLAQHLLLFGWRHGAREDKGEEASLLPRAAEGPGGGLKDEEEDESQQ